MEVNSKGKPRPRWFILFNDLLVKCKMPTTSIKRTARMKGGLDKMKFEYINQMSLAGTEVVNLGDEDNKKHCFEVMHLLLLVLLTCVR